MNRATILIGAALLSTAACNSGGDTGAEVEETPNGVTQIPPPDTNMNTIANAGSPTPNDAPNYAMMAGVSDLFEIQTGKLAQEKATSAELKAFGKQMVADHTATTAQIKKAVADSGLNLAPPTALDPKHQAMFDALNGASGADFDRLYKQQQMTAHQDALQLHQGYAANGDTPALKAIASAIAPKVDAHLNMLREMK